MDVAILQWPAEEERRISLLKQGTPRLLLVDRTGPAPVISDPDEDWVRMPASDRDIQVRISGLVLRSRKRGASAHQPSAASLTLDNDGILSDGRRWVSVPPIEAALVRALLNSGGSVVSRATLQNAAWPGRDVSSNTLDVHMTRLRRRLAPVEVVIRTVRSRGYLLDVSGAGLA